LAGFGCPPRDRKAGEFRSEQCRIMRDMEAHRTATHSYIEDGVKLLELTHSTHKLFENQTATEKRKLLDFVLSNPRWKDGHLDADYRQPFDLIASAALAHRQTGSNSGPGNEGLITDREGGIRTPGIPLRQDDG